VSGCNQQRQQQDEYQHAKQSLLALWAQRDHDYKIAAGILALVATLLGVLATIWLKGNAVSMILAIIANVVPVLAPLIIEWFTPVGGSTPGWVLGLATTLYFFAGIANLFGMVAGFFTGAGILGKFEDAAQRVVTGLSIMAFSFFAGGADVFAFGLAEDDEYRYKLQNVWDPATVIAQCEQQGGVIC
jgi:F0F1-type ATP synthase membrane subunit a